MFVVAHPVQKKSFFFFYPYLHQISNEKKKKRFNVNIFKNLFRV